MVISVGIIALLAIVAFGILAYIADKYIPEDDSPHYVAKFLKENPNRSSIYLVRNDEVLADKNSDTMFPLASTVKTIVAIEYAKQVGAGKIYPRESIELADLEKYYLGLDGGAHPAWIKDFTEKGLIVNNQAAIDDVAKGMIWYSSNANTEFLLDRLGFDNVNGNLNELGLTNHQKLYPFVSATLLPRQYPISELKKMPLDEYIAHSFEIHEGLKSGTIDKSEQNYFLRLLRLFKSDDRIWSDRLPASTTKEYYSIVKKINDRNYFDEKTQAVLDNVLEAYLQNPKNREQFEHIGGKGGSTAYVLTKTIYATDKAGNKTEMCFFFNDLNLIEAAYLTDNLHKFEKLILTDENFRNEVITILN